MELSASQLLNLYRTMLTIRRFETRVSELYAAGKMPGFVHLYLGEEAVAAGACAHLRDDDYLLSTHRGHGHCIAKGADLKGMMAELYAKSTGLCHGKGGSMHVADTSKGILGANGIIGGGFPIAVGTGYSARYRGTDQVTAAFFGDGASNQSSFHDGLNMASIWKLPVIFICENNGYAISISQRRHQNVVDVAERAKSYGMPGVTVDGNDVLAVHEAVGAAVARARKGDGPTLVEAKTWRHRGHFEGDPDTYRSAEEQAAWREKDPLIVAERRLRAAGALGDATIAALTAEVDKAIEEAVAFAEASPFPEPSDLYTDVYSNPPVAARA